MSAPRFPITRCHGCGRSAPCMQATFFQNIGLVLFRLTNTISGMLCKRCIDTSFVKMSAISFFFGWWGVISFFVTLFTLPLNVVTWLRSLSLPAPSDDLAFAATAPVGSVWDQANDPFAAQIMSAPAKPSGGSATDVLAIVALLLGVVSLVVTLGVVLVGAGMMIAPIRPDDPRSGLICVLTSSILCGFPGVLGAAAGIFRLAKKKQSA